MDRRKFVTAAGLAGAAGTLAACGGASQTGAECGPAADGERFEWRMVTAWPKDFPGLGTGANRLAEYIGRLSQGRLTVKVYGGGELVPPFETFDAVSRGTAEMGHSTSYYWKGKVPAAQLFCTQPFGLTAQEMYGWMYYGEALELYRECYAPFGILPFPAGTSGTQMGGWFNKEINSIEDIQGLKMRIPGLGGEILRRAGGTPVTTPGSEIFTALQTGTIDATEWVGPYNDLALGLFRAGKYYYSPGWQEPGPIVEALVNEEAYNALPEDLQDVITIAAQAVATDSMAEFMYNNAKAMKTLEEDHGVEFRQFPDSVMQELQTIAWEMLEEFSEEDALFRRCFDSYKAYYDLVTPYSRIAEQQLMNLRRPPAPG